MKILIDTNILIDVIDKRSAFYTDSFNVLKLCTNRKYIGVVAPHSIINMFYILRKHINVKDLKAIIFELSNFLLISSLKKKDIITALANNSFSDFEDCIQMICAKNYNCKYIVTRNIKDFKNSRIPAITPKDFLRSLQQ